MRPEDLLGSWVLDSSDHVAFQQYGRIAATFTATGDLIYSHQQNDGLSRVLLTWKLDGTDLVTDQPSHPREVRTPIRIDDRGRLVLVDLGSPCAMVRDDPRAPVDPYAAMYALAGHGLRHGLSTASPEGAFYAFLMGTERSGKRALVRFITETPEEGRAAGQRCARDQGFVICAFVWDGYVTLEKGKTDAILAEVSQIGRAKTILLVQPYTFEDGDPVPVGGILPASLEHGDSWV
jgi:hypothetical protein